MLNLAALESTLETSNSLHALALIAGDENIEYLLIEDYRDGELTLDKIFSQN